MAGSVLLRCCNPSEASGRFRAGHVLMGDQSSQICSVGSLRIAAA
jgi:hypothetical protein